MRFAALTAIALFTFIGLVQSCTITPNSATGIVGQQLNFLLTLQTGENSASILCEEGASVQNMPSSGQFSCQYLTSGQKTITITPKDIDTQPLPPCTASVSISSSNVLPSVAISTPNSGAVISSGVPFSFAGSASDSDGSVSSVEVQIGAENSCGDGVWRAATGTSSWSYSWTPPAGKENCVVRARATDNSGSQSAIASRSFSTSAQSSSCTESCADGKRHVCPAGNDVTVQCCAASDCTATCVGGKYRPPTCNSNACTYGGESFVQGQCGYNPTCQVSTTGQAQVNQSINVNVQYSNFLETAPGAVTVNCGNGRAATATCSGSSGQCTVQCTYSQAGSFTPSASIQGTSCTSSAVTVGTTAAPSQNNSNPPAALTCNVQSLLRGEIGKPLAAKVVYRNATSSPGVVNIACGNGNSVSATCSGTNGGECNANCVYSAIGSYRLAASINSVTCQGLEVSIAQPEENGLSQLISGSNEVELTVQNFASDPAVIVENMPTRVTALLKSSQPITHVSCTSADNQETSCTCTLSQTTQVDPIVDCRIQPPVRGNYQLTFTAQDGRNKTALLPLIPGQAGSIEVINKGSDLAPIAVLGLAIVLLAYGAYFAFRKIQDKLTIKQRLNARRNQLTKEIEYTKLRYMKGEISQPEFQKTYSAKQQAVTDITARLSQLEKKK